MTQGSPEQGPGFYANTEGIKAVAKRLAKAGENMHNGTNDMFKDAMFDTYAEPGRTRGPVTVFGANTAGGGQLGRNFNDLIWVLASYGDALADAMSAGAEQLSKTGDIYTQADTEISGQ